MREGGTLLFFSCDGRCRANKRGKLSTHLTLHFPPLSLRLGIHAEFGHFQEKSQGDILQNSLDGGSAGGESSGDWA